MAAKTVVRYRNRPKSKVRRKRRFTLPLAAIAGFAPLLWWTWHRYRGGGVDAAIGEATQSLTGFNMSTRTWNFSRLQYGLVPITVGLLIHKFIGSGLGVNRMLASANVPILRI